MQTKKLGFISTLGGIMLALAAGCNSGAQTTVQNTTTTAGTVCQVVLSAADPALEPLCTTAVDVAKAVEALVAQASSKDGGFGEVAPGSVQPTSDQVYAYLKAHGTKTTSGK